MDRKYSDPNIWDNSIDWDDAPDGSDGGYTKNGSYIRPPAMRELVRLRAELAEAKKFKDGMLDVLGGACPNDHRSTPFEEFKGCTPCLRAELAEARRDAERYRWLRNNSNKQSWWGVATLGRWLDPYEYDRMVDAAMTERT